MECNYEQNCPSKISSHGDFVQKKGVHIIVYTELFSSQTNWRKEITFFHCERNELMIFWNIIRTALVSQKIQLSSPFITSQIPHCYHNLTKFQLQLLYKQSPVLSRIEYGPSSPKPRKDSLILKILHRSLC